VKGSCIAPVDPTPGEADSRGTPKSSFLGCSNVGPASPWHSTTTETVPVLGEGLMILPVDPTHGEGDSKGNPKSSRVFGCRACQSPGLLKTILQYCTLLYCVKKYFPTGQYPPVYCTASTVPVLH